MEKVFVMTYSNKYETVNRSTAFRKLDDAIEAGVKEASDDLRLDGLFFDDEEIRKCISFCDMAGGCEAVEDNWLLDDHGIWIAIQEVELK